MPISTNSVIHYTDTLQKIKGIFQNGFRTKYCEESIATSNGAGNAFSGAIPMISYCDIPLSETGKHTLAYGFYGLGLTKKWAVGNGLNPVLYIDKLSNVSKVLYPIWEHIVVKPFVDEEIYTLMSYIKNYQGPLIRNGFENLEYKFYDEREWRFVPTKIQRNGLPAIIPIEEYREDKLSFNSKINEINLAFKPEDISYIILKSKDEIHGMIKFLRDIYSSNCSLSELEILTTKIVTIEQIREDF